MKLSIGSSEPHHAKFKVHKRALRGRPQGGGVVTRKMNTPARTVPRNPYPYWHKICETLENPTLWVGTEIGQNGILAILAYAYCRQWEWPPPPGGRPLLIWVGEESFEMICNLHCNSYKRESNSKKLVSYQTCQKKGGGVSMCTHPSVSWHFSVMRLICKPICKAGITCSLYQFHPLSLYHFTIWKDRGCKTERYLCVFKLEYSILKLVR